MTSGAKPLGTYARNFGAMFVLPSLARGAVLVLQLFAAWMLDLDEYAVFAVAASFCAVSYALFDFGMGTVSIRDLARNGDAPLDRLASWLGCKLLIAGTGMLACGAVALLVFGLTRQAAAVGLLLPAYVAFSIVELLRTPFRAHDRMAVDTSFLVFDRVVAAGLSLAAMAIWRDVLAGCAAFSAGAVLASGGTFAALRRSFGVPRVLHPFAALRKRWTTLWPVGTFLVLVMIGNRAHVIIVERMTGTEEAAVFAAGFSLLYVLQMASYAFRETLYPTMSRLSESDMDRSKALLRKACRLALLASVPIALAGYAAREIVIGLIYPDRLSAAADVLGIVVLSFAMTSVTNLLVGFLRSAGTDRPVLFVSIGDFLLLFTLGIWLIRRDGAVGAAWTLLATEAWRLLFIGAVSAWRFRLYPAPATALRFAASVAAGVAGLILLPSTRPYARALAAFAMPLAAFSVLGGFSRDDIRLLFRLFPSKG